MLDLIRDIILATDLAHHLRIFKDLQKMADGTSQLFSMHSHISAFTPYSQPWTAKGGLVRMFGPEQWQQTIISILLESKQADFIGENMPHDYI